MQKGSAVYRRPQFELVFQRLRTDLRPPIQILRGPRQTGKTTILRQLVDEFGSACLYASADNALPDPVGWLDQVWSRARTMASDSHPAVLLLDEIQAVPDWSLHVKRQWDSDRFHNRPVRVVLSGSSALLLQKGLTESLAGRFEVVPVEHWDYAECRAAFGYDLTTYLALGGYPGLATFRDDPVRLDQYASEALVEPSIGRDILALERVHKPALLRQAFQLLRNHSGEVLSYNKMLGQLQDSGNGTTIAHYLRLLETGGLARVVDRYAGNEVRRKAGIPKLMVSDTGLMALGSGPASREAALGSNPERLGRVVETAVGNHILRGGSRFGWSTYYWRDGSAEVDFVVVWGDRVTAVEVKSGSHPLRARGRGLVEFRSRHPGSRTLLLGPEGHAGVQATLEEFLLCGPERWLGGE